jgi:hypothetical protein
MRGLALWNIAKTLGKTIVKTEISNCTFSIKEKNYPYAAVVGIT